MRAVMKTIEGMARNNGLAMMDMWNGIHASVVAYLMTFTNGDVLWSSRFTPKSRPDYKGWKTKLKKMRADDL